MAKTTKGSKGKMASAGQGLVEAKPKMKADEPTTVSKMLKSARELIAKIPGQGKPKATVGELAKLAKEKAKPATKARTKAPTLRDDLNAEKGSSKKSGGASRAKNANLRAQTVPTGRKGQPAQPPLDDAGKRHH